VRARAGDAAASVAFLVMSTAATLAITVAARRLVDNGFAAGAPAALNREFLLLGAIAVALALATALRFFFITRLGERVAADLRVAVYRKVLTLDAAWFARIRAGEVISRMTSDLTIIETMIGGQASAALRNLLILASSVRC
jgi:ATP-binding cassette subfamily B protein